MAKYLNYLRTEERGQQRTLLSPLVLEDDLHGQVTVEAGFTTDYASLKAFHNILLFVVYALLVTYGNRAATTHDWLYTQALLSRKECDQLFFRALRADGVALWRTYIFFAGVRIGGASHYGSKAE